MTKLETLIKLNNLEKQNRKSRLEDKLKQQEYYGEIEELFHPLTKTLNTNNKAKQAQNERNLALSEQTLRAIDLQNQELDKQTKMIGETASQIEQTRNGALMKPNLPHGETWTKSHEAIEETQDMAPVYFDTKNFFMTWGLELILN